MHDGLSEVWGSRKVALEDALHAAAYLEPFQDACCFGSKLMEIRVPGMLGMAVFTNRRGIEFPTVHSILDGLSERASQATTTVTVSFGILSIQSRKKILNIQESVKEG